MDHAGDRRDARSAHPAEAVASRWCGEQQACPRGLDVSSRVTAARPSSRNERTRLRRPRRCPAWPFPTPRESCDLHGDGDLAWHRRLVRRIGRWTTYAPCCTSPPTSLPTI